MSCCGKKFIITEEDRKHILSLYGLIKEEDPKPQSEASTSVLKFDKTINFAPGYYRHKGPVTTKAGTTYNWDVDQTLKTDLAKVKEFLKNNPSGYIVEVNLYSGESKIPNNDNEQGGTQVKENHLNDARLNSLKSYLNPIFETWKTEGITKTDFKINEYKNIGETPWVGTPFCPANTTDERACTTTYNSKVKAGDKITLGYKSKYDAEQYFRVIIEVKKVETPQTPTTGSTPTTTGSTKITEDCATGLRIRVDVAKHECNNAEFFVFLNSTLLYNVDGGYTANGNNANTFVWSDSGKKIRAKRLNPGYGKIGSKKYGLLGDIGNVRYDEFIVTAEQSKEIIQKSPDGKINVWYICTFAQGCHLDTPTVKIYKNDLPIYEGQPMSDSSLLITLDGCGNKVSDQLDEYATEPDTDALRQKIQNDRMSMVIDNEKDVPDKEDTKQLQLKASNTLKTMMDYIEKLFTHPSISTIYYDKGEKLKQYQRTYNSGGKEIRVNYNIPENQELFNWFSGQKENETLTMYLDEIKRLVTQNKYQMLGDQFTDKNLRTNPLFEDVRTNLSNFYNQFNKLFKFDESGEIYMRYDDEETPYDYVRQLGQVYNPGAVYTQTLKKPTQTT
jgi:hypothetical protein